MTPRQFRKLALSFPDVVESSHMSHPDFRFQGRIFATLGAPGPEWGMIKLSPEQQHALCAVNKEAFMPASGAWGRSGCTLIRLKLVTTAVIRPALDIAVNNLREAAPPKKRSRNTGSAASLRARGKSKSADKRK
jgi:hypothetical protein